MEFELPFDFVCALVLDLVDSDTQHLRILKL